jgi:murein DD-endopeptidase MepM/ murein hydrolase activator NlpD
MAGSLGLWAAGSSAEPWLPGPAGPPAKTGPIAQTGLSAPDLRQAPPGAPEQPHAVSGRPAPAQPPLGLSDVVSGHRLQLDGRITDYVHIPLHEGRPRSYRAYRWPLRLRRGSLLSGYDLDLPAKLQRRLPHTGQVGHGAVDIGAEPGTRLWLVALEGQVEAPRVLFVEKLFGLTVATLHVVRERTGLHQYVVLLGHLAKTPRAVRRGVRLRGRWELGFVGDSGAPGNFHVHIETRRVAQSVDPWALSPEALLSSQHTVVCDPRNVFPLHASWSPVAAASQS